MKVRLLLVFIFIANAINAQTNFRNISFTDALQMAKTEGKMVFMQFESEDCDQCNEVADKGLEDKEVGRRIEQAFVPIKITAKHPDRTHLAGQYNMQKGFGTLFIDMNGALIYKFGRSTTFSKEYLNQIDLAIYSTSESARISDLEKDYANGNRDLSFLERLLTKRKTLHLDTEILLDEYVSLLPADSLQSLSTLVFIAQMAPMLYSKASYMLRKDQQLFNKAWYTMSNSSRVGINNFIIYKSMNEAIKQKNEGLATGVASFAKGTYMQPNSATATKAYDKNMLYFYEKTDTAKYFAKAIEYFDRYYMPLDTDSIKQIDSLNSKRLMEQAPKKDTIINGRQASMARISFAPSTQIFTRDLNNAAWTFYKLTNNSYLLSKATEWAKKGLELYRSPEILDTYARLLYKLNEKGKAIEAASEAIALRKERKFSTTEYDAVLDKMKRNLIID